MEGSLSLLRATWDRADSYRPIWKEGEKGTLLAEALGLSVPSWRGWLHTGTSNAPLNPEISVGHESTSKFRCSTTERYVSHRVPGSEGGLRLLIAPRLKQHEKQRFSRAVRR